MFKEPVNTYKVNEEINFLNNYKSTGVVPILYDYTYNTILMEYLADYMTLKSFIKDNKKYMTADEQN